MHCTHIFLILSVRRCRSFFAKTFFSCILMNPHEALSSSLYDFSLYVRFRLLPSATTTPSAISSDSSFFTRVLFTSRSIAISTLFAEVWSVRYRIISFFCLTVFIVSFLSSLFIVSFLSSLFCSDKQSTVRSGSADSAMTGSSHPCSRQTRKILGMPLPARSPISIRLIWKSQS